MSEGESSALYRAAVYVLVAALLVFATVTLWVHVSVYLLMGLPIVYFLFREEWDEYRKQRKVRLDGSITGGSARGNCPACSADADSDSVRHGGSNIRR